MSPAPRNTSSSAFTLLELTIAIVVIGILSVVATVGYRSVFARADASALKTTAESFDARFVTLLAFDPAADKASIATAVAAETPAPVVVTIRVPDLPTVAPEPSQFIPLDVPPTPPYKVVLQRGDVVLCLTLPNYPVLAPFSERIVQIDAPAQCIA